MDKGDPPAAAIVLAAGKGTRMKSRRPKVLHAVAGRSLLGHVLDTVAAAGIARTAVVVGPDMDDVAAEATPHPAALQPVQQGTADAVKAARAALADFRRGTVFVLYGDTPFIRAETLAAMQARRQAGAHVVVLGFRPADAGEYGRLVVGAEGALERIVEYRDADAAERAIGLCNSGVMAVDAAHLFALLDRVGNDNAKAEYYLTDIVGLARGAGLSAAVVEAGEEELMGVNSRADLAVAEARWQAARRAAAMAAGVTLLDPATVWFSHDTELAADVVVGPNVVFGPGVRVAEGAEIRAFCHLEGVRVGLGASIGPFARLRPGADIGANAHVGNFVEIKNAILGEGAKASHLTYLGDADIGPGANIGAGTITCNYDGFLKHRTKIGRGTFIGSNSALVAPVTIGDGAIVGAGSTVTEDVPADALAIGRGRQHTREGWAKTFRERMQAQKLAKQRAKQRAKQQD